MIEREEWDFLEHRVPADEIEACFYYEYARANKHIRRLAQSWRKKLADLDRAYDAANTPKAREGRLGRWGETFANQTTAHNSFYRELERATDSSCAQLILNAPDFPSEPWQKCSEKWRREWSGILIYKKLAEFRGGIRPVSFREVLDALRFRMVVQTHGEIVPFRIDWREGVEKVIRQFEAWARKRYAQIPKRKKKKARESYYEWLKQLGVLRLKERLGTWPRVIEFCKREGHLPYGENQVGYRRAGAEAKKRIRTQFPITRAH